MRELKPEEFTFCHDQTRHNFEVDVADCDIRLDLYATDDVSVIFVTSRGAIPFWYGRCGHIHQRVHDLMRVSIECKKTARVAVRLGARAIRGDVLDYSPVTLVPPRTQELAMREMIQRELNKRLSDYEEPFDISSEEEQNFDEPDEDEIFGNGYMLDEQFLEDLETMREIEDQTPPPQPNGGEGGGTPPSDASPEQAEEPAKP